MQQDPDIYIFTIIGIILGFLLVGFIIAMVFLNKRRQERQEQEMERVKDMYERGTLRSQLEIQENTLKSISQELHDNIGQMLSVVKLTLSALPIEKDHPSRELVSHSRQVLDKAIFDLSDLTKSLHTDRIADVGLAASIQFELLSVKNTGLIQAHFSVTGTEEPLPEQKAIFLFRMFQEILNNILKHAQASQVNVSLSYLPDHGFVMKVEDNGVGFNVNEKRESASSSKGVGLKSIFNRAKLIGADMTMESEPAKGTKITVSLKPSQE